MTPPTAKTLTYTGSAQALVEPGSATGGTMQYSLDGVNWSETIPTGINAGQYGVYYRVVGDGFHDGVDAAGPLSVTIGKAAAIPTVDISRYVKVGTAEVNVPIPNVIPGDAGALSYKEGDEYYDAVSGYTVNEEGQEVTLIAMLSGGVDGNQFSCP